MDHPPDTALLFAAFVHFDYYDRHYGYGFSDRIRVFCYADGEILPATDYVVKAYLYKDDIAHKNRFHYATPGEYGLYGFSLEWQENTTKFVLENANNWWRADYIFNNDLPIIEASVLEWEDQ